MGGPSGGSVRGIGGQFSGGVFGEIISDAEGLSVESPDVAIDSAGDIIVVWQQGEGPSTSRIYASYRPAGGSFGTPVPVSSIGASAPVVAMDADGDATVVWLLDDGSNEIVQAATGRRHTRLVQDCQRGLSEHNGAAVLLGLRLEAVLALLAMC